MKVSNSSWFFIWSISIFVIPSCDMKEENTPTILDNNAPNSFNLITPNNSAIEEDRKTTFTWEMAIDPEGSSITYCLYVSASNLATELVTDNITTTSYTLDSNLQSGSSFYWKVTASDAEGNSTSSEIREFTTKNIDFLEPVVFHNDADFSPRINSSLINFDGKLWIIGGNEDGNNRLNDVWNSDDEGMNWTKVNSNMFFSGRDTHGSVAYDDNIWVIGGYDFMGNYKDDVWKSTDGISWTEVATTMPFSPPRAGHSTVVFKDSIWVIGGQIGPGLRNDIWKSKDGINWIQEPLTNPFPPRAGHNTIVYDDKIWVIGGIGDGFTPLNDVWNSIDGITWSQVESTIPFTPRYTFGSVVHDNKIWVIGGYNSVNQLNDVWSSNDGVIWNEVTSSAAFTARYGHTTVVHNDKIWVIGGSEDGTNRLNDIWAFE